MSLIQKLVVKRMGSAICHRARRHLARSLSSLNKAIMVGADNGLLCGNELSCTLAR